MKIEEASRFRLAFSFQKSVDEQATKSVCLDSRI
jgi:hypothetical protein